MVIYVPINVNYSFFLKDTIPFLNSLISQWALGYFYVLVIINNTSMIIEVHIFLDVFRIKN